jgi:isopentenyldiphosphate isomerase
MILSPSWCDNKQLFHRCFSIQQQSQQQQHKQYSKMSSTAFVADKVLELLQVYDEKGNPTNNAKPRGIVHSEGLYHKVVHVWIINETNGQLLLQKRSCHKLSYPSRYDISSAGHIVFGETSLEAAQHELKEELGIQIDDLNRFELLFTSFQHFTQQNGTFIENEFVDVYLVKLNQVPQFVLQQEEVEDVKWIHYKQLKQVLQEKDGRFVPSHSKDYLQFWHYLDQRYSKTDINDNYVDLSNF